MHTVSQNITSLYDGPETGRKRHPIVRWPESFNNGYSELTYCITGDESIPPKGTRRSMPQPDR